MATLTTGVTIADGDTVTATVLHNMIENATYGTITSDDLATATAKWLRAQTATPSIAAGDYFWWDTDHHLGQVFRVYDAAKALWCEAGPDTYSYPARNMSGGALAKGALCYVASSASEIRITTVTGPTLSYAGFHVLPARGQCCHPARRPDHHPHLPLRRLPDRGLERYVQRTLCRPRLGGL